MLGTLLVLATLLIPIPQAVKVVRNKSSDGISLPTLHLTVLFGSANIASTVAVKWRTLKMCASKGVACAGGLDLFQQCAAVVSWLFTMGCILAYLHPDSHRRVHRAAFAVLLVLVAGMIGVSVAVTATKPCSKLSLGLSEFFGWFGATCAVVQFAPQLYSTCVQAGSGSLSYFTYGTMIIGGSLVATNQIFFQDDTWPVWLPLLVSILMQTAVFFTSLSFDQRARRRRARAQRLAPSFDNNANETPTNSLRPAFGVGGANSNSNSDPLLSSL